MRIPSKTNEKKRQWIAIDFLLTLKAFHCIWTYEAYNQEIIAQNYYNSRIMIGKEYKKKYIGLSVDKVVTENNSYDEFMEMMVKCNRRKL